MNEGRVVIIVVGRDTLQLRDNATAARTLGQRRVTAYLPSPASTQNCRRRPR